MIHGEHCIGRSEVNYHDIITALGDLDVTIDDLKEWHSVSDQVPFAKRQSPGMSHYCRHQSVMPTGI
jgi:hypothetical protein